jgi:hypothetical protein
MLEDPSLEFLELFQVVNIVARGDIPRSMALLLRVVSKLLAMAKDTSGLRPIAVGRVFLQLISYSIVLQLWGPF